MNPDSTGIHNSASGSNFNNGGGGGGSVPSPVNDHQCKTDTLAEFLESNKLTKETLGKAGIKDAPGNNPYMTQIAKDVKDHHGGL